MSCEHHLRWRRGCRRSRRCPHVGHDQGGFLHISSRTRRLARPMSNVTGAALMMMRASCCSIPRKRWAAKRTDAVYILRHVG